MTSTTAEPLISTPAIPANDSMTSSSYFASNQQLTSFRSRNGNVAPERPTIAIDPIALVTTECITITSAMRKNARWAHSSVASILGGGNNATTSASNLLDTSRPATPLPGTPMSAKVPKLNKDTEDLATNRWGLRGKKGKSIQDNPLIAAFSKLRAGLSSCRDIMTYDTPSLLHPFLQVIRSSSISGPITSLALISITKFLSYNIINKNSPRLALTMQMLAAAVTHCRFEGESPAQDEVVLLRILNLMEKMITGPGGELLGDDSVCQMMETALGICCQQQKLTEVLKRSAEITMITMVQVIFERLKQLEIEVEDLETLPGNTKEDMDQLKMDPSLSAAEVADDVTTSGEEAETPASEPNSSGEPNDTSESAIPTVLVEKPTAETDIESDFEPEIRPYGLPAIREVFRVLVVELLDPHNTVRSDRMRVMALRMIDVALETAGPSIAKHPSLANSAKDDLCRFLLQLVKSDNTQILAQSLRVVGTLFATCRGVLKLQQELYLSYVISCLYPRVEIPREPGINPTLYEGVPLGPKQAKTPATPQSNGGSGRSTPVPVKERQKLGLEGGSRRPDAREAMIESICQLLRIPGFMTELFVNYDCDVDRNDMCEDLVGLLSRNAFPDSATWSTTNVPPLCLDSLLNYISNMADRLEDENEIEGRYPDAKKLMEQRALKQTIIQGANEFNKKPQKGLVFLAKEGVIDDLENPTSIAKFLLSSSRLNKKVIGEYISRKEHDSILKAFMQQFNFHGKRVDEALRQLLETFRLPGESQLIERIVVTFADKYCSDGHPPEVADEDAVFVLCYAIIMLNTDQHNPNVKQQNRMTFNDFSRNLRGVNGGKDFAVEYLQSIYDAIKTKEIILPEEHDTKDAFDLAWKELIAKTDHCGNMVLCDNTNTYDEYMFYATWKPIVATLSYVFASATDDAVFTRVITGFDQCATIAAKYGVTECLDHIVRCLGNISTLSNAPMPSTSLNTEVQTNGNSVMVSELAVRFGRDTKAQLATVVLYRVITGNERHLRKGWEYIIKGLLALFLNSLIPPFFSNVQTALALPPIPMRPPQAVVAKVEQSRDVGLFSTLTSYLASYASDEPPEPSEEELESTLTTLDCINACGLGDVFSNIAELDIDALEAFVDTLLAQLPEDSSELVILKAEPTSAETLNGGPVPVDPKNVYDPAVVYVLELLTCLVLRDEKTTEILGKKLADALQGILRSAARVHNIIISRTVYYLFSLLQASHQHSFLNTPIVLHSIAILDKPTLEISADTVVKGISKCIYKSSTSPATTPSSALRKEMINSPDFWVLLRSLVGTKETASEVFQILKFIAENPQDNITADNYEKVVVLLNDFATAGQVCANWERNQDALAAKRGMKKAPTAITNVVRPDQAILDTATTSITLLQSLSTHIPTLILQSHLPRLEAWETYWHQMFNALANQCSNPCRTIRQLAFVSLQRTLLSRALQVDSTHGGRTQETTAKGVFQSVLFPLMSHLLKPEIYQSDPKGMSETRLQAANMLCKFFLHNLQAGNINQSEWFTISEGQGQEEVGFWYNSVWCKILDVLDRLVNSGQGENLEEAVVELMRNALLIMNGEGYLVDEEDERRKVWEGTWSRVERFLPALRADIGLDRPKVVAIPVAHEPENVAEEKKDTDANVTGTIGEGEPAAAEVPVKKEYAGKDD